MPRFFIFLVLLSVGLLFAQSLRFTSDPALSKVSSTDWNILFSVNEYSDVEISIINKKDSSVVRHLAAGLLGPNAPAPLTKDALTQTLVWDGKDDLGSPATVPESDLGVRVRAGLGVKLDTILGDNPYAFDNNSLITGIVVGQDGSVYICGMPGFVHNEHYTEKSGDYKVVRKYDKEGKYLRTLFPFPSNLSQTDVQGWGIYPQPDGSYSPFLKFSTMPAYTKTLLAPNYAGSRLLKMNKEGKLIYASVLNGAYNKIMAFGTDGSLPTYNELPYSSDSLVVTDPAGRIYECDSVNQRITVFDAQHNQVGSIPLACPDAVVVSQKTGAIYAMTCTKSGFLGTMWLYKFAPFDQGAARICSVNVVSSVSVSNRYSHTPSLGSLAVNDSNPKCWIWTGGVAASVKAYQDEGSQFTLVKNFYEEGRNVMQVFYSLSVDRRNETVYISDNTTLSKLYKIENWGAPKAVPCSTSAGKHIYGYDMVVGPDSRFYVAEAPTRGSGSPVINRYTLDHKHQPINYPNTNKNTFRPWFSSTSYIISPNGFTDVHGFGISYDNRMAVVQRGIRFDIPNAGSKIQFVSVFNGDTAITDSGFHGKIQVGPIYFPGSTGTRFGSAGGVRFDRQGNLYVGALVRTTEQIVPSWYAGDKGYAASAGSVIKFNGTDSGMITNSLTNISQNVAAPAATRIYTSAGLGPFSCDPTGGCVCGSPRFDLDPYGRLFLPNAAANQVSVVDNNDNLLVQFGKYGNIDSRGGLLGPGVTIPGSDIPLAYPVCAASSEDYIYVADVANCRLVRVKMTHMLDNYPGLTDRSSGAQASRLRHAAPLALSSGPVPFNRSTKVSVELPGRSYIKLDVYDARGRCVRTLGESDCAPGPHYFIWNGTDRHGRALSAGLYVYRLTAGNRILTSKTILTK